MVPERFAWLGSVAMALVGIYLSYVPLKHDLGKVAVVVLASVIIIAAILMFPWRRRPDGSPARLIGGRFAVRGDNNRVQVAGDHANQVMGYGRITHRDGGPTGG
jgi:membrane protein implicated in regulation of membrane protease activity